MYSRHENRSSKSYFNLWFIHCFLRTVLSWRYSKLGIECSLAKAMAIFLDDSNITMRTVHPVLILVLVYCSEKFTATVYALFSTSINMPSDEGTVE